MRNRKFHIPVVVQPGRIDRELVVTDVLGTANVLKHWRWKRTVRYKNAVKACIGVMEGEKPPSVARKAFILATKEARILLDEHPAKGRYSLSKSESNLTG